MGVSGVGFGVRLRHAHAFGTGLFGEVGGWEQHHGTFSALCGCWGGGNAVGWALVVRGKVCGTDLVGVSGVGFGVRLRHAHAFGTGLLGEAGGWEQHHGTDSALCGCSGGGVFVGMALSVQGKVSGTDLAGVSGVNFSQQKQSLFEDWPLGFFCG